MVPSGVRQSQSCPVGFQMCALTAPHAPVPSTPHLQTVPMHGSHRVSVTVSQRAHSRLHESVVVDLVESVVSGGGESLALEQAPRGPASPAMRMAMEIGL